MVTEVQARDTNIQTGLEHREAAQHRLEQLLAIDVEPYQPPNFIIPLADIAKQARIVNEQLLNEHLNMDLAFRNLFFPPARERLSARLAIIESRRRANLAAIEQNPVDMAANAIGNAVVHTIVNVASSALNAILPTQQQAITGTCVIAASCLLLLWYKKGKTNLVENNPTTQRRNTKF